MLASGSIADISARDRNEFRFDESVFDKNEFIAIADWLCDADMFWEA